MRERERPASAVSSECRRMRRIRTRRRCLKMRIKTNVKAGLNYVKIVYNY